MWRAARELRVTEARSVASASDISTAFAHLVYCASSLTPRSECHPRCL